MSMNNNVLHRRKKKIYCKFSFIKILIKNYKIYNGDILVVFSRLIYYMDEERVKDIVSKEIHILNEWQTATMLLNDQKDIKQQLFHTFCTEFVRLFESQYIRFIK